jgi:hypothetical protein
MKLFINKGVTLVVDRYAYSGIAFSAAKKVSALHFLLYNPLICIIYCRLRCVVIYAPGARLRPL